MAGRSKMGKTKPAKHKKPNQGFSLIESLISLTLFLLLVLSSLEFFVLARDHFFQLKDDQEANAAAYSALDKIRKDILEAGLGLLIPSHLGVLEPLSEKNGALILLSKEKKFSLLENLTSGQPDIPLQNAKYIKKNRELCVFSPFNGEVKSVSTEGQEYLALSAPLDFSYSRENTSVALLKKVSFFLDEDKHILRRRVNNGPAQPLLEDIASFGFVYEKASNLVKLSLSLKTNKEKMHEISVFPKNTALVSSF